MEKGDRCLQGWILCERMEREKGKVKFDINLVVGMNEEKISIWGF